MLWTLLTVALAAEPLVLNISDPMVTTVELTCADGANWTLPVSNGKATFREDPGQCQVTFHRKAGTIPGQGKFACDTAGCRQIDVHHRAVEDTPGTINLVMTEKVVATTFEIRCASGHRARASLNDSAVTFASVPDEACEASMKGGQPAVFRGIRWGTWYCSVDGSLMNCTKK